MKALIIQNCAVESPGAIATHLAARDIDCRTVHSYRDSELPEAADFDLIVCLGTPVSVSDRLAHDYLRRLYALLASAVRRDQPVLGICFGGQLLAHVLGADVKPNPVKEIGTYTVRLTDPGQNDPLFAGFETDFPVFQWHGDTFKVPFGADLLVSGDDCRNQAYRRGRHVGLQFHLEADLDQVPRWCDDYAGELKEFGSDKASVISAFTDRAEVIASLNRRLLDNFLRLA